MLFAMRPMLHQCITVAKCIVVGGASGFIGRHLVRSLRSGGHRVITVNRTKTGGGGSSEGSDALTWTDVERCGLPDGVKLVCNLSGRSIMEVNPAARLSTSSHRQFVADLYASRIDRIRCLTGAAAAVKPRPPERFVGVSAVGFYPSSGCVEQPSRTPTIYDEYYTGPPDQSLAGRLCGQIETAIFEALPDAGTAAPSAIRRVVVRMGVALGRDGGALAGMYWPFRLGLGGPVASGRQPIAWVHIRDAVGVLEHALFAELPLPARSDTPDVLNAVAPATDTSADLAAALAASLRRPALLPMPGPVVRLVFGPDRAGVLTDGAFVAPKRTVETGYRFQFATLRHAMRDLFGQ